MKKIKYPTFFVLLIFLAAVWAGISYGESNKSGEVNVTPETAELTPQEILKKADQVRAPGKNFTFDMTITFKKGDKETVNKLSARVKDFKKSVVVYTYPPSQKGRVLLMVEENMWIYFPGTRRPMRISPQQQLLGQVSNADVARIVYSLDYKAESVVEDNEANEELLKMTLKPKTKGAAYGSINIWIKKDSFKLVRAEFSTLAGRLLKTVFYKGYKKILGEERPTIHEIHDAINTSEISIMEYSNWKIEDTPDNYFQKTFMHRIPQISGR